MSLLKAKENALLKMGNQACLDIKESLSRGRWKGLHDEIEAWVELGVDPNGLFSKDYRDSNNVSRTLLQTLLMEFKSSSYSFSYNDESGEIAKLASNEIALCVDLLSEKGSDMNKKDSKGMSAFELMCRTSGGSTITKEGYKIVLDSLKNNGADILTKTKDGYELAVIAKESGAPGLMEVLTGDGEKMGDDAWKIISDFLINQDKDLPKLIKTAFNNGLDLNKSPSKYESLLVKAIQSKSCRLDVVVALVECGINVNAIGGIDKSTSLHLTTDPEVAVFLAENGVDLSIKDNKGRTPLLSQLDNHRYTAKEMADVLKVMLRGSDPNATDNKGVTPLMLAARELSIQIVKALRKRGAKVDSVDNNGDGIINYSMSKFFGSCKGASEARKSIKISSFLVDEGAPVDLIGEHLSNTAPLAYCYHEMNANDSGRKLKGYGGSRLLKKILDHTSVYDLKTNYGRSLLSEMLRDGEELFAEKILKNGADPDTLFVEEPALFSCIATNKSSNYTTGSKSTRPDFLLKHGANPNLLNKEGNTLLHELIDPDSKSYLNGQSDLSHYLFDLIVDYKIDVTIENSKGMTVVDLARLNGNDEFASKIESLELFDEINNNFNDKFNDKKSIKQRL